ncbi:unnamed protein product [Callosobruchus maculatus]|uniref:Cuticle protein n=1 Tax=Callosobruchus maculatus TaxID=64391 RepID=A0A653CK74_CALMS|nr:unnamed protein product [Callosobruchus maculatus]
MAKVGTVVISLAILGVTAAQQYFNPDPVAYPYGHIPFLPQAYRNADYYKNLPPYYRNADYYKNFPHYQNVDYYQNLTQYHNLPPHLRHPDYYKNLPQHYQNTDYYKNLPQHYQNADYYKNLPQHYQNADYYKNFPNYYQNLDKYNNVPSHLKPADYYKNLPQYYKDHQYYRTAESVAPIVRYDSDVREDGSYEYSYETGNGIAAQESGVQRPVPPVGELGTAAQGSYSYTSPEGVPVSISYVADENGFRAVGDVLPTPPPVPPQIQRSLEYNAARERALPTYPTVAPIL